MLGPESRTTAETFWREELGAASFPTGTVVVQQHQSNVAKSLGNRIFCLATGNALFVTAPEEIVAEVKEVINEPTDAFADLMNRFGGRGRVVGNGPAFVGYRDQPVASSREVVTLNVEDPRVGALAKDQSADWEVFGFGPESRRLFGLIDANEKLLGLSHYQIWADSIAHIGVIVAREHRGNGVGSCVVSAAANSALQEGLLPQYRTLRSNIPSMGIAESLGFEHFCDTLVIRYGEVAGLPKG